MSESSMEYNLPGVLHFLQAEWRKFERERNEWIIEKAELKARIALLEGERRGVENIKMTLMKRVKMLEYALRQERKRHMSGTKTPEEQEMPVVMTNHVDLASTIADNKLKEKSRQVLRSCLQEINYLTSLPSKLPLTNALASAVTTMPRTPNERAKKSSPQLHTQRNIKPVKKPTKMNEEETIDLEVPANVDEVAMIQHIKEDNEHAPPTQRQDTKALSMQIQEEFHLSEDKVLKMFKQTKKDELDPTMLNETTSQPKIWRPRITIKGHLDSVRSVCFHPNEMMAASGSDDCTVKIWNLKRAIGKDDHTAKKGLEEADPSITFRGHTNVVTAVSISASQNRVYSASLDSTIRVWQLPSATSGPFSPVDPSLNIATYVGHTDAIWDFKLQQDILASASADGTVKLWDTQSKGNLLRSSFTFDGVSSEVKHDKVAPTSLDFIPTDPSKMAVSFANAKIRLYDIQTGQTIMTLKGSDDSYDNTSATQINYIISHPTIPMLISGHEDRHIKFYDLVSGECIQSVSGHLDAVTSLDIDATGNTIVSGGHDSSIRLWDVASKSCIQEFSAHRKKGDEGVLSVKFHPSCPWMISGGADGIVKIQCYSE